MTTSAPDVCAVWQPQSYSAKGDTQQTVDEIRSKNAQRDAYCKRKR